MQAMRDVTDVSHSDSIGLRARDNLGVHRPPDMTAGRVGNSRGAQAAECSSYDTPREEELEE